VAPSSSLRASIAIPLENNQLAGGWKEILSTAPSHSKYFPEFCHERTREIGVEKALGARHHDIVFQFLAEAMVITAVGGLLGVLLSYSVSVSVGRLTLYSGLAQTLPRRMSDDASAHDLLMLSSFASLP
jgi:hypothetical protein